MYISKTPCSPVVDDVDAAVVVAAADADDDDADDDDDNDDVIVAMERFAGPISSSASLRQTIVSMRYSKRRGKLMRKEATNTAPADTLALAMPTSARNRKG